MLWFSLAYVTVCWEMHIPSYGEFSFLKNNFYPAPGHTLQMAAEPLNLLWKCCDQGQSLPFFKQPDFSALRWMALQFDYIILRMVDVPTLSTDFHYRCPFFFIYHSPVFLSCNVFFLNRLIGVFPSLVSRAADPRELHLLRYDELFTIAAEDLSFL